LLVLVGVIASLVTFHVYVTGGFRGCKVQTIKVIGLYYSKVPQLLGVY